MKLWRYNAESLAGISVVFGLLTGGAALLAAFLAVVNEFDYVGAGLCLLAAAFSFGLVSNALFRR